MFDQADALERAFNKLDQSLAAYERLMEGKEMVCPLCKRICDKEPSIISIKESGYCLGCDNVLSDLTPTDERGDIDAES